MGQVKEAYASLAGTLADAAARGYQLIARKAAAR
jgi:hypothetical protein